VLRKILSTKTVILTFLRYAYVYS